MKFTGYILAAATTTLSAAPTFAQEVSFSTGPAKTVIEGLIDCGSRSRPSAVGEITSEEGAVRTVPAATHYQTGPHAPDLYNACAGIEPDALSDIDLDAIQTFDAGGTEAFTAYIFGDNYFELYVNGQLIAVDSVPFTPFNASVVKFTAQRPLNLAIMGVDWEENLGLGSEAGRGSSYYPGDAGLVMQLQDASGEIIAITDTDWRAQTFYVSPLQDRDCLVAEGQIRDSSSCSTAAASDGRAFSAAYWDLPADWMTAGFDDSSWPNAVAYTNETVGVDNKPGYTNFTELFDAADADASFIWSSNLVLDNLVLLRRTIE